MLLVTPSMLMCSEKSYRRTVGSHIRSSYAKGAHGDKAVNQCARHAVSTANDTNIYWSADEHISCWIHLSCVVSTCGASSAASWLSGVPDTVCDVCTTNRSTNNDDWHCSHETSASISIRIAAVPATLSDASAITTITVYASATVYAAAATIHAAASSPVTAVVSVESGRKESGQSNAIGDTCINNSHCIQKEI